MGSVRWSEVESSHYPYLTEFEKKNYLDSYVLIQYVLYKPPPNDSNPCPPNILVTYMMPLFRKREGSTTCPSSPQPEKNILLVM